MDGINQLIADNIGLVRKQLNRFNYAHDADAISFAMEGLMKAAYSFSTAKNVKFSTYATVCIYNELAMYSRAKHRKRVLDVTSYDAYNAKGLPYSDCLSSKVNIEEDYITQESSGVAVDAFNRLVDNEANETVKRILLEWQQSEYTASQTSIAKTCGVSQAHVSRTIAAALTKLKDEMEEWK